MEPSDAAADLLPSPIIQEEEGNPPEESSKRKHMKHQLHLGVNDVPSWGSCLLFGFQQAMLCISGLLVYPYIVSEAVCAGNAEVELRVQLISSTFVACGIATILQTTLGLRLSVLHGPAIAFLPPLLAYKSQMLCNIGRDEEADPKIWMGNLQTIGGSLLVACLSFLIIGGTGLAGVLSRLVGPVTITPLMLLLSSSIVPTIEQKMSFHWISIVMLLCVCLMAVYFEDTLIPVPVLSGKRILFRRVRLFGQFPYLLSLSFIWFICYILTVTRIEPEDGGARTDKNVSVVAIKEANWFMVPFPGVFGLPRISFGLTLGYVASCAASVIENLGSYSLLARVSHQKPPPVDAVNRAIIIEGLGSALAASMGVCTGVTTYSENIALIHITRVASRRTMQMAGFILILIGIFGKGAALLAAIPEAVIGGMLAMGVSMIAGVSLSNLQNVDLRLTRNLSIIGLSFIIGQVVPLHFEKNPIRTGVNDWDDMLNMLLTIKMLTGGLVAVFLDNTVPGATASQRGLYIETKLEDFDTTQVDGYSFSPRISRLLRTIPLISKLPFMPSETSCPGQLRHHSPTSSCAS